MQSTAIDTDAEGPPEPARSSIGWIGTGRMGAAMARRLLGAGCDVAVYNRTRAKAEQLITDGAKLVDCPGDLAERDIVFVTVGGPDDLREVILGEEGLLSRGCAPKVVVDSSTVSAEVSAELRLRMDQRGSALLVAPVSGNPRVARAGRLTMAVSGPEHAYRAASPYLAMIGAGSTYVGDAELARLVKLCHNLFLGVVAQSLAEITVLAEKGGVRRSTFLEYLNKSVMGSLFTSYKSPALVNLDFAATFTSVLLRKDFDLGLANARELEVPMPVAGLVYQIVQRLVGEGYGEADFAALLELEARAAGMTLVPEDREVSDGLEVDGH